MAYDTELADRLRELLATEDGVVEKRMFGGLGFLIGGHMAVAASGRGGILLRVDPEQTETLLAERHAERFEMRGRALTGWLWVQVSAETTDDELGRWVEHGVAYVRSLPPKEVRG